MASRSGLAFMFLKPPEGSAASRPGPAVLRPSPDLVVN